MAKHKPSNHPPKHKTSKALITTAAVVALAVCVAWFSRQQQVVVLARATENVTKSVAVKCMPQDYPPMSQPLTKNHVCNPFPNNCGRAVMDGVISPDEAKQLISLAETFMQLGGGSGPPTILDLTSGALSKGTKFVDAFQTLANHNRTLDPALAHLFVDVSERLRKHVEASFAVDGLVLASPTFFSRINNNPAKTPHDEYWHVHVDTFAYPSFSYTGLLYLNTYGVDFDGGRFFFVNATEDDPSKLPTTSFVDTMSVEPKPGRLLLFSSGSENKHRVEQVSRGVRYVVTISFSCDVSKQAKMQRLRSIAN